MCGIAGFLHPAPDPAVLDRMTDALAHRGPDDRGAWIGDGAALGHRRLSILDLSPLGRQPMASGRWVLTFNGEIYNHHELRAGRSFHGRSDTEVLLRLIEEDGIESTLPRLNGMFAFAAWDRRERALWLARDRFGEKPLYHADLGGSFAFASEPKALRRHPGWTGSPDRAALALYLRLGYVPAPHSAWLGVRKLPPGCLLRAGGEPKPYFRVRDLVQGPPTDVRDLEPLLREAVRLRMESDVPLGAFLSGGLDSSTIVALMQSQSSRPVKTFTIGFREQDFDEAAAAAAVARHLKTEHTELTVTAAEARDVIPSLVDMYDEPFADSSAIPTHLVSKLTRRHVTVALSGDAGDELFGGYRRYLAADLVWRRWGWMPGWMRRTGAAVAGLLPGMRRYVRALAQADPAGMYLGLVTHWERPPLVGDTTAPPALVAPGGGDQVRALQVLDLEWYLPEGILVKVDRASMAAGLEARAPFLDPAVASFALRLPAEQRIRSGETKWALRQVLYRHVSKELVDRPKQGFGIPLADWLRGPLRDWAEGLLGEGALKAGGLLDPVPVRAAWSDLLGGRSSNPHPVWAALMLAAWANGKETGSFPSGA